MSSKQEYWYLGSSDNTTESNNTLVLGKSLHSHAHNSKGCLHRRRSGTATARLLTSHRHEEEGLLFRLNRAGQVDRDTR